jgi:hypothetical protein
LLTPQASLQRMAGGQYSLAMPRSGRFKAALRSLLVPGAGQRYMGREAQGNFFLSMTASLAAATIVAHDVFLDARRDQAEAQYRFDNAHSAAEIREARSELEDAADRVDDRNVLRWTVFGVTAGMYLWNIIDAFQSGDNGPSNDLSWSLAPTSDGVMVCATWSLR